MSTSLLSVRAHTPTSLWYTPARLYYALESLFGPFDLDPCCTPETARAPRFYAPPDNGLELPWSGRVFVNPPYGRGIRTWLEKAVAESVRGAFVVALIPASTGAGWWHEVVIRHASDVKFLRGKVKFGNAKSNAPFWSAVALFGSPR